MPRLLYVIISRRHSSVGMHPCGISTCLASTRFDSIWVEFDSVVIYRPPHFPPPPKLRLYPPSPPPDPLPPFSTLNISVLSPKGFNSPSPSPFSFDSISCVSRRLASSILAGSSLFCRINNLRVVDGRADVGGWLVAGLASNIVQSSSADVRDDHVFRDVFARERRRRTFVRRDVMLGVVKLVG